MPNARRALLSVLVVVWLGAGAGAFRAPLTVLSAGPTGELASLADASQVRVEFSQPMVPIGHAPADVTAPFFEITPAVAGSFRWAGTTTLIFTPDAPLPYATRYDVRITTQAVSATGNALAAPHTFSFTTPAVRLMGAEWYREQGRVEEPIVVALRFNQPVDAAALAAHLSLRFAPHDWTAPVYPEAARDYLRRNVPDALAAFERKVRDVRAVAARSDRIPASIAASWDTDRFPSSSNLVVLRTTAAPPPESWIDAVVGPRARGLGGPVEPGAPQHYTLQLEPAFFVDGVSCHSQCDPSDWNAVQFRAPVGVADAAAQIQVSDITAPASPAAVPRLAMPPDLGDEDQTRAMTLEEAGYRAQPPASTYAVSVGPTLTSADGQRLGYQWVGVIENWHESAFTSFGDGHGVWEKSGGAIVPFSSRNFQNVTQWVRRLGIGDLMARVRAIAEDGGQSPPPGPGTARTLQPTPDQTQAHGLDLGDALDPDGTGLVWAAIRDGAPIPRSKPARPGSTKSTIVQVTNLGLTIKDAPEGTLVFVTRLDDAQPVAGAAVSLIGLDEQVAWRGVTGADGVAMAPAGLRDPDRPWQMSFIAVAEKDGDVAYAASDWNEGVAPWAFGLPYETRPATGVIRGTVFSDRGVYRPGEAVHFKTVLRRSTADGVALLAPGTPVTAVTRDSRGREVDRRSLTLTRWSSAEWSWTVPDPGSLGTYFVQVEPDGAEAAAPPAPDSGEWRPDWSHLRRVDGSFLVAAYRRPEFSVDTTLTPLGDPVAGVALEGTTTARYLFGASMGPRPVRWSITRRPVFSAPSTVHERFPERLWTFVGYRDGVSRGEETISSDEEPLDASGGLKARVDTEAGDDLPHTYTFEAEVEDVSRQRLAGRSTQIVHPAPWYLGLRQTNTLVQGGARLDTAVVAVSPEGDPVAGVPMTVALNRVQWHSVRRAEGNGFYTWDSERRVTPVASTTVTSAAAPLALQFHVPEGGSYEIVARAADDAGRQASTVWTFYATGPGYTAWQRYDHQRIDLVPEKTTWRPGESARLMIQSPWESATALVTVERERVRSHRTFALTSTQQTIDVPLTEADIPNVYVSVLLVKGRSSTDPGRDGSDPGKPAFRLGYAELRVDDARKRLSVDVSANRAEYRPASTAEIAVHVRDHTGRGAASDVTLWAVDEGVLQLTGFSAPDLVDAIYPQEVLQVMTSDSRARIVSRRVLTPKGSTDGGGGGVAGGPGDLRRDFRVLAFWLGSLETGADGRASTSVTLPESMTSYRIMAVAADAASRFGSGRASVRVNRPVTLRPVLPRFMTPGDRASIGAAVTNTLPRGGTAIVSIESADPARLRVDGASEMRVDVAAGATASVLFGAEALSPGAARVRVRVRLGDETDAFEIPLPIGAVAPWETTAAHGQTGTQATVPFAVPSQALADTGSLRVDMASTALVGLNEGARYLVEYPYGCVEQRASRALALMLIADLGEAFALDGLEPAGMKDAAQQAIDELHTFQCPDGGFAYWPGQCGVTSPYLAAYVVDVLQSAAALGYRVDTSQLESAYGNLARALTEPAPVNAAFRSVYTAWQAFSVRALVRGGQPQDSAITSLVALADGMPVFALSYLADAMHATNARDPRLADVERRIENAIRAESASASVNELADPELAWVWSSNTRSTAIVMRGLIERGRGGTVAARMARHLLDVRDDGRWNDTQENATALAALVAYYRAFEAEPPDFAATVTLGDRPLLAATFKGRSTDAASARVPLDEFTTAVRAAASDLVFEKTGSGTLHYGARVRYQLDPRAVTARDNGFRIDRRYEPFVEEGTAPPATAFAAGDLVRVVLTITVPAERRFVAVTDALPAGFEAVDGWFQTTARDLAREASVAGGGESGSWFERLQRGGFDHVEKYDDRVQLFATRLGQGTHQFSYLVRATTAGTFLAAPAWAEQMYAPEVNGRGAPARVEVRK